MDVNLTDNQNRDIERLMPVEDFDSFAEAKRAIVKEGLKVYYKKNGMVQTKAGANA